MGKTREKNIKLRQTLNPSPTKKKRRKDTSAHNINLRRRKKKKKVPARERRPNEVVISQPIIENGNEWLPLGVLLVGRHISFLSASHPRDISAGGSSLPFAFGFGLGGTLGTASLLRLGSSSRRRRRRSLHWKLLVGGDLRVWKEAGSLETAGTYRTVRIELKIKIKNHERVATQHDSSLLYSA